MLQLVSFPSDLKRKHIRSTGDLFVLQRKDENVTVANITYNNRITIGCVYLWVFKHIWIYGIQLWGTASNSNIEILQRFQSKTPQSILKAPRYLNNQRIHEDL
jgi:hypothetical protein